MEVRKEQFPNFKFKDKIVANHDKARVSIMIHEIITNEILPHYNNESRSVKYG